MKKWLLGVVVAAFLAGCASGVKLDDVPVEDGSKNAVVAGQGANAVGASQSGVQSVDLNSDKRCVQERTVIERAWAGEDGPRITYIPLFADSRNDDQGVIEIQANYLKGKPRSKAMLEGHIDERGGREYNLALGQRRAEAVARAMALLGVAPAQMEAVSFGKEKPASTGSDEANMAKNRRVEVTYK